MAHKSMYSTKIYFKDNLSGKKGNEVNVIIARGGQSTQILYLSKS